MSCKGKDNLLFSISSSCPTTFLSPFTVSPGFPHYIMKEDQSEAVEVSFAPLAVTAAWSFVDSGAVGNPMENYYCLVFSANERY